MRKKKGERKMEQCFFSFFFLLVFFLLHHASAAAAYERKKMVEKKGALPQLPWEDGYVSSTLGRSCDGAHSAAAPTEKKKTAPRARHRPL